MEDSFVWFGKVVEFMRIQSEGLASGECESHK